MAVKCPKCQTENPETKQFCADCGTQLPPSKDIHPEVTETLKTSARELTTGATFAGRYQIVEELGHGGMGKVYKVHDTKIGEKIALKLIRPEALLDRKTVERFTNELKLARKIRHKNICQMFDLGEDQGTRYITMEYIHGEDLKQLIRKVSRLSPGQAIGIARQVCEGLEEAHKLGVVHRDLKPQNIMIDEDGNARIMDFGIARSLSGKGITGAGVMIGTPEYMSPEQVEGKETDPRSDIYSLGIILYEMVTGRVPFEGDTPFTVGVKHKSEPPKDPRELNAQIPQDLSRLILRCLEKDKSARYQTAAELGEELEKIEKDVPTATRLVPARKTLTSREITVKFTLRKLAVPVSIIVAIAAVAVIVWRLVPHKQPSIAVLPFADLSQQKDQEYLCDGMLDEIIAKLQTLGGWKVMNRTSSMRYKGSNKDIRDIGRELDVRTILQGSVRKDRETLRISAGLVNVKDGYQLWAAVFDQKLEGIFTIQSDIAENIVRTLKVKLTPEEKLNFQKKPTENLDAYNSYLQGRFFWNKRTGEDMGRAIQSFNQAIDKDPRFALAYSGLAETYAVLPYYTSCTIDEAFSKVMEFAQTALKLDSSLAESYSAIAFAKMKYRWDWKGAENDFKSALKLNPNYATAHFWYAAFLRNVNRYDESSREFERALELDPVSHIIIRNATEFYFESGQFDKAIAAAKKLEDIQSDFSSHFTRGRIFLQKAQYENALEEFEKEKKISTEGSIWTGVALRRLGREREAQTVFRELEKKMQSVDIDNWVKAVFYTAIGNKEQAFKSLKIMLKEEGYRLVNSIRDPALDSLRSDPRFKDLLKKMNLE